MLEKCVECHSLERKFFGLSGLIIVVKSLPLPHFNGTFVIFLYGLSIFVCVGKEINANSGSF